MAWSDGELAPEEITGICDLVAGYSGIGEDRQVALRRWLDPPTPQELEALSLQIVEWAESLSVEAAESVVDLGVAIAESTSPEASVTARRCLHWPIFRMSMAPSVRCLPFWEGRSGFEI
ncbi:MAG: hypothetical protein V3S32_08905 [Acidimicrobiia bacterium]